jgi:hypothetical protein
MFLLRLFKILFHDKARKPHLDKTTYQNLHFDLNSKILKVIESNCKGLHKSIRYDEIPFFLIGKYFQMGSKNCKKKSKKQNIPLAVFVWT